MLLEGVGVVGETSLWRGRDLNPQPTAYESVALPIELPRHWLSLSEYTIGQAAVQPFIKVHKVYR